VRVLAVEWLDPPFLPGHWVPEMMQVAGGVALGTDAAVPSRQVAWETLAELDPDVLVVMPCGYGLEAARTEANVHAEQLQAVAPRAVDDGRAWVVDGSAYFNRSGPRVVDGVEILGAILHPVEVAGVDLTGRAARWSPTT
jgi:iron complex transport system substrate-binding protein